MPYTVEIHCGACSDHLIVGVTGHQPDEQAVTRTALGIAVQTCQVQCDAADKRGTVFAQTDQFVVQNVAPATGRLIQICPNGCHNDRTPHPTDVLVQMGGSQPYPCMQQVHVGNIVHQVTHPEAYTRDQRMTSSDGILYLKNLGETIIGHCAQPEAVERVIEEARVIFRGQK